MDKNSIQNDVIDVCLRRGIVFPTAEIYNSYAGFYEYGPVGVKLRENLMVLWQQTFINSEDNVHEISGSTIMPEAVFDASGHLDGFHDPLTQCNKCNSMFRIDHLIEELGLEILDENSFNEQLKNNEIICPNCPGVLSEPRNFNMMFKTNVGPLEGNTGYLRPETAQNIFINFRRIEHSMRASLPFGVAQIGRAYRNEISPRNFLMRLREFEQLELEMFVDPDEINNHPNWVEVENIEINLLTRQNQSKNEKPIKITIKEAFDTKLIPNQYIGYYLALETMFMESIGISNNLFHFRELKENEVSHYSSANYDLEIVFPFGVFEVIGLAYRTDYDLKKHSEKSGAKLQINQPGKGNIVPHVIEPSAGLSRLIYAVMLSSYVYGEPNSDRDWNWFNFTGAMAPWEAAILPLMKKDGMSEGAKELYWQLKDYGLEVIYDESGKIGKRYARNDEIGVKYCITYDYDSLEKDLITIRDRDTMHQVQVKIDLLPDLIRQLILDILTWSDLENEFGRFK